MSLTKWLIGWITRICPGTASSQWITWVAHLHGLAALQAGDIAAEPILVAQFETITGSENNYTARWRILAVTFRCLGGNLVSDDVDKGFPGSFGENRLQERGEPGSLEVLVGWQDLERSIRSNESGHVLLVLQILWKSVLVRAWMVSPTDYYKRAIRKEIIEQRASLASANQITAQPIVSFHF